MFLFLFSRKSRIYPFVLTLTREERQPLYTYHETEAGEDPVAALPAEAGLQRRHQGGEDDRPGSRATRRDPCNQSKPLAGTPHNTHGMPRTMVEGKDGVESVAPMCSLSRSYIMYKGVEGEGRGCERLRIEK